MNKNNFLSGLLIIFIFALLNGCASVDQYKYKDSRMAFKIDVDEPQVKETKKSFYLIDEKITVFPFIDNRNFDKTLFATDIPLSILFSKTIYKNLLENLIFREIKYADEAVYKNKTITFDEKNFPTLKDKLKTDAILTGIIYEFDIVISPDKIKQQYVLTLHMRGDIKIMSDDGTITYYHDYNKLRSYTFKTKSYFSYSASDVRALGPYVNNFLEWIVDGEINHLITKSEEFVNGKTSIENLIPDVLTYPQENTKLYDASIISSAILQKQLINGLGMLGGGLAGCFTGYYLAGGNSGTGLGGAILGIPVGMIAGFFITNYFTDKLYEENEKKAIFYALNNRYNFVLYFPILNLKL